MGTWWSRGGREETQEMENKKGGCYSTPPTSFLFEDQDQNMFSKYLRHIWRIQCKTFVQNFVELVKLLSSAIDFFQFTSQADSQTRKYICRVEAILFCISANTPFSSNKCATAQPSLVGSVESQTKVDLFSRVGTLGHTSTSFVPLLLQFCTHITTSAFDPTDLIQMCWYIFVCHPAFHRCFVCCIFRSYLTLKGQERHRLIKQTCWDHDRIWYFFLIILQKVIFICITSTSMSEVHLNPHKGQRGRLWFQYLIFLPNNLLFQVFTFLDFWFSWHLPALSCFGFLTARIQQSHSQACFQIYKSTHPSTDYLEIKPSIAFEMPHNFLWWEGKSIFSVCVHCINIVGILQQRFYCVCGNTSNQQVYT